MALYKFRIIIIIIIMYAVPGKTQQAKTSSHYILQNLISTSNMTW